MTDYHIVLCYSILLYYMMVLEPGFVVLRTFLEPFLECSEKRGGLFYLVVPGPASIWSRYAQSPY